MYGLLSTYRQKRLFDMLVSCLKNSENVDVGGFTAQIFQFTKHFLALLQCIRYCISAAVCNILLFRQVMVEFVNGEISATVKALMKNKIIK